MGALFGPLITWFLGTVVRREVEAEILRKKKKIAKKKAAAEKAYEKEEKKKAAARKRKADALQIKIRMEKERQEKSKRVQADMEKRLLEFHVPAEPNPWKAAPPTPPDSER